MNATSEFVVTIDGPAGAGKSTLARSLAQRLGVRYLDTGAMYRAMTLAGMEADWNWADDAESAAQAALVRLEWEGDQLLLNGRDVTERVRQRDVTDLVHLSADNPAIRARLVELQRAAADTGPLVTEGRDQGTVVFPNATCKIFLTADPSVRAERRLAELRAKAADREWDDLRLDVVLKWVQERDERDRNRRVGALRKAEDAIEVDTTSMNHEQVLEHLESLVRSAAGLREAT